MEENLKEEALELLGQLEEKCAELGMSIKELREEARGDDEDGDAAEDEESDEESEVDEGKETAKKLAIAAMLRGE